MEDLARCTLKLAWCTVTFWWRSEIKHSFLHALWEKLKLSWKRWEIIINNRPNGIQMAWKPHHIIPGPSSYIFTTLMVFIKVMLANRSSKAVENDSRIMILLVYHKTFLLSSTYGACQKCFFQFLHSGSSCHRLMKMIQLRHGQWQ